MIVTDGQIDDFITTLLLRLRRASARVDLDRPSINPRSDLDFLRMFWAATSDVELLATRLVRQPHEAASALQHCKTVDTSSIRGRVDARDTIIQQALTGNPAVFVSLEAKRSYATGPNHVVAWVLEEARRLCRQMLRSTDTESSYFHRFGHVARNLEQASRLEPIRMATSQLNLSLRPSAHAVTQAKRSRIPIYQLAADAYLKLLAIERGDIEQTRSVLQETLLGPLEMWRRFELCVALAIGESLARVTGGRCDLSTAFEANAPLISVGRYRVYWQTAPARYFTAPRPEPSEAKVDEILSILGLSAGWDRPDVVVVDTLADKVVALAEVKHFTGATNDGRGAIRAAIDQLVRYSRGYRPFADLDDLLSHSMAVPLRSDKTTPHSNLEHAPWIFDFMSIQAQDLDYWSHAVILDSLPSSVVSSLQSD